MKLKLSAAEDTLMIVQDIFNQKIPNEISSQLYDMVEQYLISTDDPKEIRERKFKSFKIIEDLLFSLMDLIHPKYMEDMETPENKELRF